MTATLNRPRRAPPQRDHRVERAPGSTAMSFAAALAVITASTALAGVLTGISWLGFILLAVGLIAVIGAAGRRLRLPAVLIVLAQLFALLCTSVLLFTDSGAFRVLPDTRAVRDLGRLLGQSIQQIQSGIAPVAATAPLICLSVLSVGLAAVAADILAVALQAPATSGLVLLCIYAVPASLSESMLPVWTFVFGAAGFGFLLATDKAYRVARLRGSYGGLARGAFTLGVLAVVASLIAGGTLTVVGTQGRLPGTAGAGGATELGLSPLTNLRGLLDENTEPIDLFRVTGLGSSDRYLRALTLSHYVPNQGWARPDKQPAGAPLGATLAPRPGEQPTGATTSITITPQHWRDLWLPVFPVARRVTAGNRHYRYNAASGVIYSFRAQAPGTYTEQAALAEPSAAALRAAPADYTGVDKSYLAASRVNPRITRLAEHLTAKSHTEFDKAKALWRYFTDPSNGFTYSTATAPATSNDALYDFLFNGKTGFCEQYATSMAVMLRQLGIPSRVAIGFTDGTDAGKNTRQITT
ncbi:MAG: transglutaminaseTgpA domain-containing protein, partial [Sciscionella sp.]